MWTAIPDSLSRWDFTLMDEAGVARGRATISAWRERGSVSVDDATYDVTKAGEYLLGRNGDVIARAEGHLLLTRRLLITSSGQASVLRRRSLAGRTMVLCAAEKEASALGEIAPDSVLSGRYRISLDASIPPPVAGFIIWLALLSNKIELDHVAVAAGIA